MKREIKFRAWNSKVKEWFFYGETLSALVPEIQELNHGTGISWEDIVLMQFTGLLDKNGKEIYESDLIKEPSGDVGEVYYETMWGMYAIRYGEGKTGLFGEHCSPKECEITGNIYEN